MVIKAVSSILVINEHWVSFVRYDAGARAVLCLVPQFKVCKAKKMLSTELDLF